MSSLSDLIHCVYLPVLVKRNSKFHQNLNGLYEVFETRKYSKSFADGTNYELLQFALATPEKKIRVVTLGAGFETEGWEWPKSLGKIVQENRKEPIYLKYSGEGDTSLEPGTYYLDPEHSYNDREGNPLRVRVTNMENKYQYSIMSTDDSWADGWEITSIPNVFLEPDKKEELPEMIPHWQWIATYTPVDISKPVQYYLATNYFPSEEEARKEVEISNHWKLYRKLESSEVLLPGDRTQFPPQMRVKPITRVDL